ncbi:C2 domain-containing protein 3 [Pseudophryne corroboree]|uniref:C2 domain-containing protein 3 n=1 Tax=Pseudophryne corroboree TaxID=495146 RepID=UPI0030812B59
MKCRGSKSGKAASRRKKGATDVCPSTSLPPLVEGQLRCFLRVTVSKILWTVPKPPQFVVVRLRWWGETSDGTIFHPRDTSQTDQKGVNTTTRYAVRCGPKQLTSYLTDMGALVVEVMTRIDHLPIGRAQINQISRLSPTHPLNGFFTVVSPTSEKMGELQVSVALEPLCETYDSSRSISNTDISLDTALSKPDSSQPRKLSVMSSGSLSTPRGIDHLYFKENTEPNKEELKRSQDHWKQEDARVSKTDPSIAITQERSDAARDDPSAASAPAAKDLLTVLLHQGNRLRDAIAESALRLEPNLDGESVLSPVLVNRDYTSHAVRSSPEILSSRLHQNLLNVHKSMFGRDVILQPADHALPELHISHDDRAIELLLGSSPLSPGHYWDGTGSPPESMAGSDFYNESELNDPHYDQSLLENLFYTTPKSDGSTSDYISDDDLSKSQRNKNKNKAVRNEGRPTGESPRKAEASGASLHISGTHRSDGQSDDAATRSEAIDLTIDRLTLLGRMHVARVIVESLKVQPESTQVTPSKRSSKGRPPRPAPSLKRTFFLEFRFPVSSKNKAGQVTAASEITRLVSNKIAGGVVTFQQRFVFPVLFSGHMIQNWWNADLTFTIYLRKGTQKKAELLGSAVLPLRDVLRSEDLSVSLSLPVHSSEKQRAAADVGPLKVSVAIAGESREGSGNPEKLPGAVREASPSPAGHSLSIAAPADLPDTGHPPENRTEPLPFYKPVKQNVLHQAPTEGSRVSQEAHATSEESSLLLHVVLCVPEGKGLTCGTDSSSCNPYLNFKLLSCQDATRSAVVWGSAQPVFNFSQVAPVCLTRQLLERIKNNVMVIEVWNKAPTSGADQLVGLAKLPLHQFYMSFSDRKVCRLLLQAQYPVVAVDSFVPITDMLSGDERGRLKVLLAMGSGDQVMALQRLQSEVGSSVQPPRPAHFLDQPQPSLEVIGPSESTTDHVFEIHVENVKGLTPLQSTVWGEADCFIQYYFPVQSTVPGLGPELPERGISLKPVRTATTLCVPDPVFNDRQSHSLVAPSDTPVQRLLLGAFSTQGLSGGGGLTFEVWCRYYYPNVRDQMVAKGVLPLSRLCAMVTMHHREEVGIQAFCLPLTPMSEIPAETRPPSSGLLSVNVSYRRSVRNLVGMLATRMVSISVQIHRASGLQAAARVLAQQDPSFQYSADVGVNAFTVIRPPFLPEAESRSTRTVARSFCPEFDHHSEFPCSLVTQRSSGEACSLAEILHFSEIVLSIHHQSVTQVSANKLLPARDHQLGVVRIPARDLLTKRSGISGWYPVMIPEDTKLTSLSGILENVVGGLELSVGFAHHSDRERVLEVARGLGWSEYEDEVEAHSGDEWQKEDLVNLSVTIPKIWLPVHCLLIAGHRHIQKSTYCYLRYKLYDKEAVCSPLKRPTLSEDSQQATVVFEQSRSIELMKHQPLVWYLREEKLEIQIWRSYGKDTSGPRPQETDRLLGCAYVDLTALSENTPRTLSVSGVYPLFKRNSPNLWGAAVRAHLSMGSAYHPTVTARCPSSAEEQSLDEDDEAQDVSGQNTDGGQEDHVGTNETERPDNPRKSSGSQPVDVDLENTFAVNIVVERAMHLSLKGSPLTERAVSTPSCCVSFPVAGDATPVATPIMGNTDSPTWNFQLQARLSRELLLDPQQTLVFKVWHKADVERVLGFASVDLSPLLSGFQSVCGWYNIGDFAGQCQGQIKVSVTPLENISHLKEERRVRSEAAAGRSEVTPRTSFLYHPIPHSCGSFTSYPVPHTATMSDVYTTPCVRSDEEHLENMQRFQESVRQAEWHTRSAEHLDALSQSSRTSLLSALRKNISELDDIQRYFHQKLYRSLSNTEPPGAAAVEPPTSHPEEDADAHLLLRKSNLLVSQVSSLITGLQESPIFRESPPSTSDVTSGAQNLDTGRMEISIVQQEDQGRLIHHQELSDDEREGHRAYTPPFSAAGSPSHKEDHMDDLPEPSGREGSPIVEYDYEEQDLHSSSDEEYEENLIEPRTLNEFTTMTDRTSPWSSMLSDMEPGFIEHSPWTDEGTTGDVLTGGNCTERLDVISSVHDCDQPNTPSSTRSCQNAEEEPRIVPYIQKDDLGLQETETYRGPQSAMAQSISPAFSDDSDNGGTDELRGESEVPRDIQAVSAETISSREPDAFHVLDMDYDGKVVPSGNRETEGCKSGYQSSSHCDSTQPNTSPSLESSGEQRETGDSTDEQSVPLLCDPILLPNFFLPPQHLEASMRALSLTPALPSSTARTAENEARSGKGIPFRRRTRQMPRMTAAELPKEEANRIARIFAAQFSNKK